MTERARRRGAMLLAALLAGAATAAGGAGADGTDLVFGTGQMANVETGRAVVYAHSRRLPAGGSRAEAAAEEGRILLSLVPRASGPGRAALVRIEGEEGRTRALDPFPAGEGAGNPVLLAFLEFTARAVSEATGGSPFYIRNRIRDAFRRGGETAPVERALPGGGTDAVAATRIAYRPFEDDPNSGAMGDFAGLEIAFEVADVVPGGFLRMQASTGGAEATYLDRIAYSREAAATAVENGDRETAK